MRSFGSAFALVAIALTASPAFTDPVSAQTPAPSQPRGDAQPYGFWAISEGADGVKVGVIFPDYSPSEFVGALLYCVPRSGVRISLDSAEKLPAGSKADVAIFVDGSSATYKGTVQDKATEDASAVVVETTFNDPILAELSNAKSFGFSINGIKAPLPSKNSQNAFREFFEKCQR